MASSGICYQPRVLNLCVESPQHGSSEVASRAIPYQQSGWSRVSKSPYQGALRTSSLGRPQYYHCMSARQDTTSNERFHEVGNLSPALWPSDNRGHARALRQCNALPASESSTLFYFIWLGPRVLRVLLFKRWSSVSNLSHDQLTDAGAAEGDEEEGTPWEGAIVFRRSAAQSRFDYFTTLERLGLSRFSSEKAMSLATVMGLQNSDVDGVVGTPVQVSVDCTKKGRDIRVDGVIRTAMALVCNRCLAPCAERIYASFNLLLTEAPVKEPTQTNLGVVLGDNPHIWSDEAGDEALAELDLDLDDKLHFPRDEKELDISKYLRDTIHLEIPAKSLCDSDCPGFCFGCGVNLNNTVCRCGKQKKSKNAVNMDEILGLNKKKDIWGPLEQLKKQLEKQQEQQDRSDDPK